MKIKIFFIWLSVMIGINAFSQDWKSIAQKDVTQFLGIPVDGYKPEMIKKLKEKGFTTTPINKDVLVGEFNGKEVELFIATNNNKVYRIMVADANRVNETDIKIRFNTLCQQFHNNKKYFSLSDSSVSKFLLSEDENISYELSVNNKRYEAVFYQKTKEYDSLLLERNKLINKDKLDDNDVNRLSEILTKVLDENNYNKVVWFMISEFKGEYYISIFYDNNYNKAKGEDL